MKNYDLRLNQQQLTHKQHGVKCDEYCSYPGCKNCLCGKRRDSQYCCDLHRSQSNNEKSARENNQIRTNTSIHIKNCREIKWLYEKGNRVFNIEFLKATRFDLTASPVPIIINGRKVAAYGDIIMWIDENQMCHLEKREL